MFSPAVGRVARSAASLSAAPARTLRAALSSHQQPANQPGHQRRQSSSKPLAPPNNKKKPAALEQNAPKELQGSDKRAGGSSKKLKRASAATQASNIPMVPPTNHLREDDVKMSAFFGLHRPISIQNSVPGEIPIHEFNAIFDLYTHADAQTIQKTKFILGAFLQRMYAEIDAQEEQQADAAQASAQVEVFQLNTPPTQQNVENWVARLVPFSPPAPPVPYDMLATKPASELLISAHDVSASINQRVTEVPIPSHPQHQPSAFREHIVGRWRRWRPRRNGMLLISVKRQRKLKMKKHKYKKLMKRTRLLRRKLDRL